MTSYEKVFPVIRLSRIFVGITAGTLFGLLTPGAANAQGTVTGTTVRPPEAVGVKLKASTNPANDSPSTTFEVEGQFYASRFIFTQTDLGGTSLVNNASLPAVFDTYCVELGQSREPNPLTYDLASTNTLGSPTVGGKIAWLYNTYSSLVTNAFQSAALQVAIWEERYDGGGPVNLDSGKFILTDDLNGNIIRNQAITYLNSVGSNTSEATWLKSDTRQDLIGPARRIPEPGALALLAMGLPAATLLRRKRI